MISITTKIHGDGPPGRGGLRAIMPRLARDIAADIRKRTASGRDVDGRAFTPHPGGKRSRFDGKPASMVASRSVFRRVTPNRIVLAPGGKHTARAYSNQTGEGNRPARRVDRREPAPCERGR